MKVFYQFKKDFYIYNNFDTLIKPKYNYKFQITNFEHNNIKKAQQQNSHIVVIKELK